MNDTEFRAVLDWWMCCDPWSASFPPREVIDGWLQREGVSRGYPSIISAYHQHEATGNEPAQARHRWEPNRGAPGYGFNCHVCGSFGASKEICADIDSDTPCRAQPLSDAALARIGEAMLADRVAEEYVPSRAEIAMHALNGILAHSYNDASFEGAARDAVAQADHLLAELSKSTGLE